MKTAVLIFVLISAIICLFGEAPYWQWATSASVSSANGSVESRAIANDSMGNSYVVGSFSSIATFGAYTINSGSDQTSDIFVAKLDNSGEYVWVVQAGGSFSDNGNDIALDSTGSIVITGSFRGTASFGDISLTSTYYSFYPGYGSLTEDIFVAKLDSNGNWIWVASVVGTSLNDIGNAIAVDNNSNVYITGKFEDTATFGTTSLTVSGGQFDTDAFVAKLNSNGSWIWARKAGGISYEEGYDVVIDNESNVVITGYFHATCSFGSYSLVCTSDGEFDIFVAKLDSSGNWLWASKAGGNSSDYGFSLVSDTDNNIYVTGRYENNAVFGIIDVSGSNVFVGKMNSGGTWLWVKTLPLDWGHKRKNITIDDQDNVYYTGTFENEEVIFDNIAVYNIGGRNSYVAKLSNSGNWIWVKQAGSYTENSYISSSSISVDGDETVYLCGSYYGSAYFGNVNLDANGMFVTMLNMTPQPEFILSSYIIDYGAQSSSSVTEFDLVLRNNGAVSGEITDITITGSTFFYADLINRNPIQIPYSLAAGDSISLTIHYLPEQMGYHEAMLNITINNYWVLPILLKGYLSYFIDSGVILQSAWGMSIVWGDYDNDGDLDLFNNGLILRNDGNGIFTDVSAGLPTGCAGSWGDYDNDGDLDLAIIGYFGAEHICRIYRNEGNDIFIDINAGLSGVRPGSATWGDYDNDGDLDLLVTGWDNYHIPADNTTWSRSITRIYANNGDGTFFDINADFNAGHQFLHGYDKSNWADVDNDGDLDVFVTGFALPERASVSLVFRNDGNNLFTTINTGLSGIDYGETTFGDYDNDGDLDVLQSGYSGGSNTSITTIYRNEGNFVFTNISADLVGGTSSAWGDYDNDGDLDLLLTGSDFFGEGFSFLYRNDGNGVFTEIQAGLLGVSYGTAIWGDYDNDGNLDILLTGSINLMEIIKIYRNEITIANQSPTFPSVSYDMSNIMIYSYGSYDDTTPSNAIHYNFRIGYTPGGCEIVSPMALDSGLRKLCAYGNSYTGQYVLQDVTPDTTIYVTAQALDNSFFGSAFSPEIQVVTPALHLTYPNGGEVLQAGTISHVDWADNSVKELNVQISIDNGLTWSDVNSTPVASAPGTYEYTVPDIVSSQCLIKMVWAKDDSYYDISDTNFAISSHVESYAVINETQIQFGNSWINHTATREFSIGNEGMQPLSVSLFVGAGVFSVSTTNRETIATRASVMYERSISADRNEVTITIPPMTTETVYVHFLPTAIQNYSRNLFIETNAPNLPTLIIPLSGTGYILFAEFTANPATGDVPLEVSFINQSVAGISRSLWDFGDGISSEETNPVHTFTQEGLYNVQLTVWDNYFSTSVTHAVNVIAHPLLTCNQSAGHSFTKSYLNELSAYFDVILQSSGTDTLYVTNIHWKSQNRDSYFHYDFDNLGEAIIPGGEAGLQVWFHPLTEGVFADTLCIVNNSENHPLLEIPFSGRGYRLHASFSYDPISGDVPLTVTFTDTSTEDIIQWDWDFGDGNTSSQQNPVHIFEVEGVYAVELTISDGIHFDSVSHPVEVIAHALMSYSGEPSYNFGIVYLGDTSDMITLTLQSSGTDTLYVHDIRWKNNSHGFYYSFGDYSTPILPGNAASIDVWFQPSLQGAFSDSLIIETNAENLPVLKVKFSGRGEYVPPKPPENVTILMAGYNAVISWDAVTQTIYNTPFIPDCYLVFYNGSADPDNGPYYYLAATNDLSSTHFRVGEFAQYMFYRVIAYKSYNREHNDTLILNLQPGMTEKEVLEVLREL